MRIRTIALALLLVLFLAGCDGFTHIEGKITDVSGKPIEGAHVEMKTTSGGRDDKAKTDAAGRFSIGFTHAPFNVDLVLTVTKEGYKPFEKHFTSREGKRFPPTIVLEANR